MCNPLIFYAAFVIASTALTVSAQQQQARQQRKAMEYQADIQKYQAQVAQQEASYARKMGEYNSKKIRRDFLRAQGQQRSLLAVSGVDTSGGSALDVLVDTASRAKHDQQMALHEGEMNAWRSMNQSRSLLAQSQATRMKASNSRVSDLQVASAWAGAGTKIAGAGMGG